MALLLHRHRQYKIKLMFISPEYYVVSYQLCSQLVGVMNIVIFLSLHLTANSEVCTTLVGLRLYNKHRYYMIS